MRCIVWYISLLALPSLVLAARLGGRTKRFLIFPRQSPTRHLFIAGIGIPADLSYESLVIGHVLKTEFFLPYNATVYRQNPYLPEYKHQSVPINSNLNQLRLLQKQPSQLRWQIYAYIEHMLDNYGYNGHECMLQAICEANTIQFSKDFSVVQELLHVLFAPSTSLNAAAPEAYDFTLAEKASTKSNSCEIYDCNLKLLDWFSQVMHII
ncbi:uncharacterized protein LOC6579923 [Drosophila mojavensis]|uniref:Uncharacterized protein n=1 Tax=Drosophila mojavensis TaxID=7230 RepID=B4KLS1_DROMO|nr:uncharacterized protein LOC6579923 [Drosophila mojavensis]EDW09731.1 uncharacterized protein Dmoj_GI20662 [Drosophila mojavensis]